jgi:hypothetical protein
MHASPRALARAGIVFLVAVLADNRPDFGTVHFNHPPSAAVHFSAISIQEPTTLSAGKPLFQRGMILPRPEKWASNPNRRRIYQKRK